MRKDEFLQTLRRALTGDVPPSVIEENLRYYDSYITDEVRKGRREEEVIEEIGDPRLIARTIEETTEGAEEGEYAQDAFDGSGNESQNPHGGRDPYGGQFKIFRLDKWYVKLLAAIIVFFILYLVVTIVGGIFALLSPILMPFLCIWVIVTLIRNLNNR